MSKVWWSRSSCGGRDQDDQMMINIASSWSPSIIFTPRDNILIVTFQLRHLPRTPPPLRIVSTWVTIDDRSLTMSSNFAQPCENDSDEGVREDSVLERWLWSWLVNDTPRWLTTCNRFRMSTVSTGAMLRAFYYCKLKIMGQYVFLASLMLVGLSRKQLPWNHNYHLASEGKYSISVDGMEFLFATSMRQYVPLRVSLLRPVHIRNRM